MQIDFKKYLMNEGEDQSLIIKNPKSVKLKHKKIIGEICGYEIYEVDGYEVRELYTDFTEGGHPLIYDKFIPKKEIWLEKLENKVDMMCNLTHEFVEILQMQGISKKLNYNAAHEIAANFEKILRSLNITKNGIQ